MSIAVMKQALEVLEQINQLSIGENAISLPGEIDAAMDNLRAAIDQTAEPVAWMYDFMSDNRDEVIRDWMTQDYADIARENGFNVRPLYAAPSAIMQKPVAYADSRIHGWPDCFVMEPDPPHTVPLYTAPREWVELTDDEARALVNRATFGDRTNWQALVYMVDAKLKEKNA
jgi:hypothetical protein